MVQTVNNKKINNSSTYHFQVSSKGNNLTLYLSTSDCNFTVMTECSVTFLSLSCQFIKNSSNR